MAMFRFENLDVWKDSRVLIKEIYTLSTSFPKDERFGLTDQIRRAAVSIALNIAEGSDRKSDIEFKKFLRSSIGSLEEVVSCLYIAMDLGYIKKPEFDIIYINANVLAKKLNAFVKSLTNKSVNHG